MDGIHILLEEWKGILSRLNWKTTAVVAVRCPREVRVVVIQESSAVAAYRLPLDPSSTQKHCFQKRRFEGILLFIKNKH